MSFMESFKKLEMMCSDMYQEQHGVTVYIDDMKRKSNGSHLVSGWNDDLKQLIHYRDIRNKITHEAGCTEENMCSPCDALWVEEFYNVCGRKP